MRTTGRPWSFYILMKEATVFFLFLVYTLPVQSAAQTVTIQRSLNFDRTQSGASVSVSPGGARSACFVISGTPGSEVQITFGLPSVLTGNSSNSLPVYFGPEAAGYNNIEDPRSLFLFDPDTGLITNLSAAGSLYIWLGGIIHPDPSQKRGSYRTDITLTASYTTE